MTDSDASNFDRKVNWLQTVVCSLLIGLGGGAAGFGWHHRSEVLTIVGAFVAGFSYRALFARGGL